MDYDKIEKYVLECIDGSGHGVETTPLNIYEIFKSENTYNLEKLSEEKAFNEWIYGLPNSFNMDFETYRILELGKEFGIKLKEDDPNMYSKFSAAIFQTFKKLVNRELSSSVGSKEGVLKLCKVQGLLVKLPDVQLDRSVYVEVKNALELIGGKWKDGKVQGFEFKSDPSALLEQIADGEKRNLKKEFQFFETPEGLADELASLLGANESHTILEPSAGQGALVKAVRRLSLTQTIDCYELMPINQTILKEVPAINLVGDNFLESDLTEKYDRIIANPPFSKNQDITHIQAMYNRLKPGGRLVSVASTHWQHSSNKREKEFRAWLKEKAATVFPVEAGNFKESGTMIPTVIIVIDKY